MSNDSTSTLKAVVNLPEVVKAFGKDYAIARFNVRQMAATMEYAGYIGVLVVQAMKLSKQPGADELITFVTQGIGVSSPAFIPIVSIATGEPIEWIEEQDDVVGALEIFVKAVRKNKDFFSPANVNKVKALFAELLPPTPTSGGESSTISFDTATATTPS